LEKQEKTNQEMDEGDKPKGQRTWTEEINEICEVSFSGGWVSVVGWDDVERKWMRMNGLRPSIMVGAL